MKLKDIFEIIPRNTRVSITLNGYYKNGEYYSFMTICHNVDISEAIKEASNYEEYEIDRIFSASYLLMIDIKEILDYNKEDEKES